MIENQIKQSAKTLQRELALVKVEATGSDQDRALSIVGAWSGRLLDLGPAHFTAEVSADPEKVSLFIDALQPFGLAACFRSGAVTLA
jgi:acetolactate synthase-1/3 small subunit